MALEQPGCQNVSDHPGHMSAPSQLLKFAFVCVAIFSHPCTLSGDGADSYHPMSSSVPCTLHLPRLVGAVLPAC